MLRYRPPSMLALAVFLLAPAVCNADSSNEKSNAPLPARYYFGADLSFVNELEKCGATYAAADRRRDPFELLHERGANLVRVRLWNDARWTRYSDLADVKKTIRRAHRAGMQVLLDFHYSDDWADGDKQIMPRAWEKIRNTDELAEALYDFTYRTLRKLDAAGLMPELVQVGNETNGEILSTLGKAKDPIDWARNAKLLNAGIKAVRDSGASARVRPRVMLHIAQPENVEPWFAAAAAAGVTDFDLIGVSYYRKWSTQDLRGLGAAINRLRHRYAADVLLVEAAYPWTLDNNDTSANVLGEDSLLAGYPASPQGQRRYLLDLSQTVLANGGVGVVYWEPAWISSSCRTRWGKGSGWENATLFDFKGRLLPGADYLDHPYIHPVEVEFRAGSFAAANSSLYLWGDFLGEGMGPVRLDKHNAGASFRTRLMPGQRIHFQLYSSPDRGEPLLQSDEQDVDSLARAVTGIGPTVIDLDTLACGTCVRVPVASEPSSGNFNEGWQFHRFDEPAAHADIAALPPSAWEQATLPHTPRLEPRIVNDQWQGVAVYRKRFKASDVWRGKRVWLRLEAAMNGAEVRLNGTRRATHLGGYLPVVVDLTDALRFRTDNELTVWLDNRDNDVTGPKPLQLLDFNTYGGLYRDASLIVKGPLHITDEILADKPASGGVFVTYPRVSRERAEVAVKTHVRNEGRKAAEFRIVQTLWEGKRIAATASSAPLRLPGRTDVENVITVQLDQPKLWSPRSPHLYRLVTAIEVNGETVDEQSTRVGVRRIEIARDSVRINGERMFLRGVNRHQEYPYVGYALSAAADYRDARRIKEAGFDFVRLSHYPQSPAFMAAADELGLVLMPAILGWQYFNPAPAFEAQVLDTCRDLIRRDRNHPSVMAWECSLNETQMPAELVRKFHAIVHEEYPGDQAYSAGWQNDGYDIYIQARQHRIEHYEPPDRPYLVSEYGDWEYYALNAGFKQETWTNLLPEARTSRQPPGAGEARLLQQSTNVQEAHNDNFATPAFADAYWAMFDYNRGYADDLESSGVMSLERVPKFSYYFFRSQRDATEVSPRYSSGPMVFIASYWQPQSAPRVRVFGNVEEVELRLDGRRIARQRADADRISMQLRHPPFTFSLPAFEAGTLEAIGYIGGRAVVQHRVTTPATPGQLLVELDDAGVCAESGDLLFARARLLDRLGTTVPLSGPLVDFEVTDGLAIVGPVSATAEAGVASVLVRIEGGRTGTVIAKSGELRATESTAIHRDCSRRR